MRLLLSLLFFSYSMLGYAAGYYNTSFFSKKVPSLKFTTTPQTIYASICSSPVTVTSYLGTTATNVSGPLTVNLSGTNGITFFSDSSCTVSISSVVIASGTNSANFYFLSPNPGSSVITLTATAYPLVSQTENFTSNPFIWTGGGGSANWNVAGNWSGLSVPGPGNIAVFTSACSSNCSPTMTANPSIGGVRLEADYTGTITQNSGIPVTVGSAGWIQKAGTFTGSVTGDSIAFNGPFKMTAGTFTATSGVHSISSEVALNGSSDYSSVGTVVSNSDCCSMTQLNFGSSSLQNFTFSGGNSQRTIIGTMRVNGNLNFSDTYTPGAGWSHGGTIEVLGNVTVTQWGGGSATVKLIGSGTQTITGGGINNFLPSLHIASTGTVNIAGTLTWKQSNYTFRYDSGAISPGTSHLVFLGGCGTTSLISNGLDKFNSVTIGVSSCTGQQFSVTGNLKIGGELRFENAPGGSNGAITGGSIEAHGDIVGNTFGYYGYGSPTVVNVVGTGTQNITSNASTFLPSLTLAASGTVNLSGIVKLAGNTTFTYSSGTLNAGTSTLFFGGGCSNSFGVSNSSAVFYNLTIQTDYCTGGNYTLTGTFVVSNNLHLSYDVAGSLSGGVIDVKGAVTMTSGAGGSTALTLSGSSSQSVTRSGGSFPNGAVTVNNSSGVVLNSSVSWNAVNVTSGFINMSGNALTVNSLTLNGNSVTKGGGVLTVNGSVSGTGSLHGGTVNP